VLPWVDSAAARRPDHPALIAGHETLTWAELAQRAGPVSAALAVQGVGEGDRVALALPAGIDFVAALHGCLRLGAVAVPVDLRLGEAERKAITAGADRVVDGPTPNAQRPTRNGRTAREGRQWAPPFPQRCCSAGLSCSPPTPPECSPGSCSKVPDPNSCG
jgi:hypothetical protein